MKDSRHGGSERQIRSTGEVTPSCDGGSTANVLRDGEMRRRVVQGVCPQGERQIKIARIPLLLPAADAAPAGFAWPLLNAGIHGLCVEWIAVTMGELYARRDAPPLACMRDPGLSPYRGGQLCALGRSLDLRDCNLPRVGVRQHTGGFALRLNRNRRKLRRRPERFRRQHCLGKVQGQELVRAIFVRARGAADKQQRAAKKRTNSTLNAQPGLRKH
jgi:hypothetical protein